MAIYYKLARPDGWDFYTGKTINYRDNIGKIVSIRDTKHYELCSHLVIHASSSPNYCFLGSFIPCSAYEVEGDPVIVAEGKHGFVKLKVVKEIFNLDALFGWKYTEVTNPINPLQIRRKRITKEAIALIKRWAKVGDKKWLGVEDSVKSTIRASILVSTPENYWIDPRSKEWNYVGDSVVTNISKKLWPILDSIREAIENYKANLTDHDTLYSVDQGFWAYIGSFFPKIKYWSNFDHKEGKYPFQIPVELWKKGFMPSFDGKIWRLHAGTEGKVLWEGQQKVVWKEKV